MEKAKPGLATDYCVCAEDSRSALLEHTEGCSLARQPVREALEMDEFLLGTKAWEKESSALSWAWEPELHNWNFDFMGLYQSAASTNSVYGECSPKLKLTWVKTSKSPNLNEWTPEESSRWTPEESQGHEALQYTGANSSKTVGQRQ